VNLYRISQDERNGYDTYDACVVAAESDDDARRIYPTNYSDWSDAEYSSWASCPENVTVELIGLAAEGTEPGVICSSFNAG
jgi:hypothetical protein